MDTDQTFDRLSDLRQRVEYLASAVRSIKNDTGDQQADQYCEEAEDYLDEAAGAIRMAIHAMQQSADA